MNRRVSILAAIVALSFGLRVWLTAAPITPPRQSLAGFPQSLGGWEMVAESSMSGRLEGVLAADDYIIRDYRNPAGRSAGLFVAYYKVMHAGEGPHSPRNCLPGSGWAPIASGRVEVGRDAAGHPLVANRYVVEKDGQRELILYWFQARGRVIASEYWGLLCNVWDALRSRRRDEALVRVTVPMGRGGDEGMALRAALDLAHQTLPQLGKFVPD